MAATTTARKTSWIVCDDFAAGPYTAQRAAKLLGTYRAECANDHRVVVAAVRPATLADLRDLRDDWDAPYDADPGDELAASQRGALTAELAQAILRAPLGARLGGLTIAGGSWSKETADAADLVAAPGTPEWRAALGARSHATLTGDGGCATREGFFCRCAEQPAADTWVRYEAWTAQGRDAHGFVCPSCRRITQTG